MSAVGTPPAAAGEAEHARTVLAIGEAYERLGDARAHAIQSCAKFVLAALASAVPVDDRQGEVERLTWRCFHCDFVASDKDEAGQHFGPSTLWEPACVASNLYSQADVRREAIGYHDSWRTALARAEAAEAKLAALTQPAPSDALIDGLRERIAGVVEFNGHGFWNTCSGCAESSEGVLDTRHYPRSAILGCQLGGGCSECGGIGAVWDDTDYEEYARFAMAEPAAQPAPSDAMRLALTKLTPELLGAVMQDAWGEICDDAGAHPDDMRREGRKLFYQPRHWTDLIAMRLRDTLAGDLS